MHTAAQTSISSPQMMYLREKCSCQPCMLSLSVSDDLHMEQLEHTHSSDAVRSPKVSRGLSSGVSISASSAFSPYIAHQLQPQ